MHGVWALEEKREKRDSCSCPLLLLQQYLPVCTVSPALCEKQPAVISTPLILPPSPTPSASSRQFPQQSRTCSNSSRRVNQQQDRAVVVKCRFSNLTGEVVPGCLSLCVCVSMCLYKPLCLFFSSTASLKTNRNNSRKTAAAVWCICFSALVYQKKDRSLVLTPVSLLCLFCVLFWEKPPWWILNEAVLLS